MPKRPTLKTKRPPRRVTTKPRSPSSPSGKTALLADVALLPKVLQDAHRRTSRYIASIKDSGVVHFTAARTRIPGWVFLVNVENAKGLPMGIEVPVANLIYVAEEGDAG